MSRKVGEVLTEALMKRLNGDGVEQFEGKIIPIFTLDERGWPHPALLSYYEIVARSPSALDMALWKDSSTANNLRHRAKVTMMITDKDVNYYLKGGVQELEHAMAGAPQVSRFRMSVDELLEDQEANAQITTGLTYVRQQKRDANDFAVKVLRCLREVS